MCSYRLELHLRTFKRKIERLRIHFSPNGYILELFDANDRQFVVDFGDEHIVEPMDTVTKMKQFSGR